MDEQQPSPPRRLHPASAFFRIAGYVRQLILPAILALFASGGYYELVFGLFIIPLALYEVFNHFKMTYQLSDDQLIVRRGVLFRNERHIPFAQIQNVDLVENVLHRMLGVAEVRVETAGGA